MARREASDAEEEDPVQLHAVPVSETILARFDSSPEARRLDRLQADQELLLTLALNRYEGTEFEVFADVLARYGIAVLRAWCHTGHIFPRCAEKGLHLNAVRIPDDDAFELALETVAKAIDSFRRTVLIPAKWDPKRGASLKTFFIGHCLFCFPNLYRSWLAQERCRPHVLDDPEAPLRSPSPHAGPEGRYIEAETLAELLDAVEDPTTREIVQLKADGYSNDDIAELCNLSIASVKSRLHRLQRKDRGVA